MTKFQVIQYLNNTMPPPTGWYLVGLTNAAAGVGNQSITDVSVLGIVNAWKFVFLKPSNGSTYVTQVDATPTELQLSTALTVAYTAMALL